MLRVLEVCRESVPVVAPALDDNGIGLAPLGIKSVKRLFRGVFVDRLIDKLQVFHELFLILAGNVFDGVANLMHYAQLHGRFRKDARDGIRKALEAIHAGDKNVLNATLLKVAKDAQPEVGALALGDIHPQQFFPPLGGKRQHIVDGTGHRTILLVHDLVMNGIQPNNGIHRIKRAALPGLYLREDAVGYAADGLGRYAIAKLLLQDVAYLAGSVADGIQADDTVGKRVCKDLLPFAYIWGSKVPSRSRGVLMVTSPMEV